MKKLLLLSLVGLMFTACDDLDGELNVTDSMSLKDEKKTVVVAPGTYQAEIEFSKKRIKLKIDGVDGKFRFKIPKNRDLPRNNGTFSLTAAESGQNYNLTGEIQTTISQTASVSDIENCARTVYRRRCHFGRRGRQICSTYPHTIWINTRVEYHYVETHKYFSASVSNGHSLAYFNGADTDRDKVYTAGGFCGTRGRHGRF